MTDVCFLCERNPITWPGTGMCERCHQETADLEHQAEREANAAAGRRAQGVRVIPDLLLRVVRPRVPSLYLERNGIHRGDCPWCDEDGELSKSLFVYPTNLYRCFACGATGDAIQFLMSVERLRFIQAVEWLAKECDLRLEPPS